MSSKRTISQDKLYNNVKRSCEGASGETRYGCMASSRICDQAWLPPRIICIDRGQRLIEIILSVMGGSRGWNIFFSLLHVSSNFKTKLFKFFLQKSTNTFCFVIANLGRLVAAKMRLSINCIEFAYSRPIVYPRPCLIMSLNGKCLLLLKRSVINISSME